jgi:hypothetical protein
MEEKVDCAKGEGSRSGRGNGSGEIDVRGGGWKCRRKKGKKEEEG